MAITPKNIEPNFVPIGMELPKEQKGFEIDDTPAPNEKPLEEPDEGENWSDIVDDDGNIPDDNATEGATVGTNLKDSGATVLDDTDVMNIRNLDYGETINGATLPVAIYQSTSDNEVYACDANDSTKLKFLGFAIENKTDGNSGKVQVAGRVGGFSGLSEGEDYFVQDDKTIGTSKGTYTVLVGVATSTTEIKIFSESIDSAAIQLEASDALKASADTERSVANGTAYTKKKEIAIYRDGEVRIKFDAKDSAGDGGEVGARVYVNDVAVGTERINDTSSYVNYSEDFTATQGDLFQLYIKQQGGGTGTGDCRNFRIYYDKVPKEDYVVNTD